jgi:hypothetical protein
VNDSARILNDDGGVMRELIEIFTERGDLAHLALLLWAMSASAVAWFALRELAAASRRFDGFVRERTLSRDATTSANDPKRT